MAARTNEPKVKQILDTDPTISVTPFIDMANPLTDKLSAADTDGSLTTSELERIETLLAAHFLTLREQQLSEEKNGQASGVYQGRTGKYFEATHYGQAAIALDDTNWLAKRQKEMETGNKKKVSLIWLGEPLDSVRPRDPQ